MAKATRETILKSAAEVFQEKGYHRTSVDDITRCAHIAHGTFYRYFCNKQDALRALVSETLTSSLQLPAQLWSDEDLLGAIRQGIATYFDFYVRTRDLARIWVEAASYDEEIAAAREQLRVPFVHRVTKSIKKAIERRDIPVIDAEVAANAVMCMVDSYAYQTFVIEKYEDEIDHLAETLALIWYRGIGHTLDTTG